MGKSKLKKKYVVILITIFTIICITLLIYSLMNIINWKKDVDEFIENIYIHEDKNIEIKLRFKNQYEDLLKCLKNQNIMI